MDFIHCYSCGRIAHYESTKYDDKGERYCHFCADKYLRWCKTENDYVRKDDPFFTNKR